VFRGFYRTVDDRVWHPHSFLNEAVITLLTPGCTLYAFRLQVHQEFQAALEKQMDSRKGRNVSKPFLAFTEAMKVYGKFCCDVPMATKKLTEMQSSAKMLKILEGAKRESNQRFALKDLLNVPMQRLLK
jgi:hypothetical protein